MAEINLIKEEEINVNLTSENPINANVPDINYIPGYKVAEEQRRANELERITNENEREVYYVEIQRKVANGEFNGKDGIDGKDGKDGVDGLPGKDGVDGKDGETQDLSNYYTKEEVDNLVGDIESILNEVV